MTHRKASQRKVEEGGGGKGKGGGRGGKGRGEEVGKGVKFEKLSTLA